MASVITQSGEYGVAEVLTDGGPDHLHKVAVGDDTTSPTTSDTSLGNKLYESTVSDSNVSITSSSNSSEIKASITVSAGTEVAADASITELGIFFDNGDMLYREVRNSVTVTAGETVTLTTTVDVTN